MKRDVIVKNESGMHARPASIFVKKANGFNSNIEIEAVGKKVNAKSIMGILSLGITKGNQISIIAEGEDDGKFFKLNIGWYYSCSNRPDWFIRNNNIIFV